MITVREYRDGDLDLINAREPVHIGVVTDWAFTLEEDGDPIAAVGCYDFWNGVGHIWMAANNRIRGNGLALTRIARSLLASTFATGDYNRIHAFVEADSDMNNRWIRTLGMRFECRMEKMSPRGGDINVYVITG